MDLNTSICTSLNFIEVQNCVIYSANFADLKLTSRDKFLHFRERNSITAFFSRRRWSLRRADVFEVAISQSSTINYISLQFHVSEWSKENADLAGRCLYLCPSFKFKKKKIFILFLFTRLLNSNRLTLLNAMSFCSRLVSGSRERRSLGGGQKTKQRQEQKQKRQK